MSILCALGRPGVRIIGHHEPSVPDIWGVWMGLGGVTDADPRFRNIPRDIIPVGYCPEDLS